MGALLGRSPKAGLQITLTENIKTGEVPCILSRVKVWHVFKVSIMDASMQLQAVKQWMVLPAIYSKRACSKRYAW